MILQDKYSRDNFLKFLDSFIPNFEKDIRPVDAHSLKVTKEVSYLGECAELDLEVFEITHVSTRNPRVALATDGFRVMKHRAAYQALVVYKTEDSDDWRLSLMTVSHAVDEKGKISATCSNPRRFSYFLGPNAQLNTPRKYLIKPDPVDSFEELQKRFSMEVVSKEFYKSISESYTKLVGGTIGKGKNQKTFKPTLRLPSVAASSQHEHEFAVRLIGRIIFCWFLREKKGSSGEPLMPKTLLSLDAARRDSDYYHKILEPIFFEVLNKQGESRKVEYSSEDYALIPYLNGGLFSPHEDYYSSNASKQAVYHNTVVVPDEWHVGLFEVLETYNFTIDENTSFDEELSIDPEMLGRIFENLLAEINPETGESARKSTGSYYTPRVIVDCMVDESLYLYLKEKTRVGDDKLRAVISYDLTDDLDYPLDPDDKAKIIEALEELKLIDPACGSGAFPIGALQKIVFILQQVDPDGQLWFKKQIEKTSPELQRVLEREFSHKNYDYIRKLGIIRENIYGVDVQPIATEISRLRCFLTLVVDERVDDSLENRGIEPLPNLDFKFVTANTLIGLPQIDLQVSSGQQGDFLDDREAIHRLRSIRDRYFNSPESERGSLKTDFDAAQKRLMDQIIIEHAYSGSTKAVLSQMLSSWEPFSNKSSAWFDPEWMFGVREGFDIVIANPPYLKERDNKAVFKPVNDSEFGKAYHQGKMDFWYYFLHKAIDLVKEKGAIAYITSRYWLNSSGAKKLIKRVQKELSFVSVLDIGKLKVFNEVAGQHMVAIYSKGNSPKQLTYKKVINELLDINETADTDNLHISSLSKHGIFTDNHEIIFEEFNYNTKGTTLLSKIVDVCQGVVQNPDKVSNKLASKCNLNAGEGVFVLTEEEFSTLDLNEEEMMYIKPFYDENDYCRYRLNECVNKYLIYLTRHNCANIDRLPALKKHLFKYKQIMDRRRETINGTVKWFQLHWPRDVKYFDQAKIVQPSMFANVSAALVEPGTYFGLSTNMIIQKDVKYDLKYTLAILNSRFAEEWFYKKGKKRGAGVDIGVLKLRQFPIKKLSAAQQKPFIDIVDRIFAITKDSDYLSNESRQAKVKEYGGQIDQLVYELYGLT